MTRESVNPIEGLTLSDIEGKAGKVEGHVPLMFGWKRVDPIEIITHVHNTFEGRDEYEVMDYL